MALLSDDDLAYMRATQAEARPTLGNLLRKAATRSPTGGTVEGWGDPEPVTVRIDGGQDEVPTELAGRLEGGTGYQITIHHALDIRDGDKLEMDPATEVYEIITDGDPDRWATAQTVWARRLVFPARTA